jgi:hypothetical protein
MRIIHYTLIKPFVMKKWGTVPPERIEDRVKEAAQSKWGMFRDEMYHWGQVWKETRVVYAGRMEECYALPLHGQ